MLGLKSPSKGGEPGDYLPVSNLVSVAILHSIQELLHRVLPLLRGALINSKTLLVA